MSKTLRIRKLVLTLVALSFLGTVGAIASSHSATAVFHWYSAGQKPAASSGIGGHWSNNI